MNKTVQHGVEHVQLNANVYKLNSGLPNDPRQKARTSVLASRIDPPERKDIYKMVKLKNMFSYNWKIPDIWMFILS